MKARPIIFSGAMIRALLAGTKTQTRRIIKAPTARGAYLTSFNHGVLELNFGPEDRKPNGDLRWHRCPYGAAGDLLYVRESHYIVGEYRQVFFSATNDSNYHEQDVAAGRYPLRWSGLWKPSIHMPRWASRLTLRITDVRVQRLLDISCGDALEEGCPFPNMADGPDPRQWYAELWDAINGPGSWGENPWVWALDFDVIKANVDNLTATPSPKRVRP